MVNILKYAQLHVPMRICGHMSRFFVVIPDQCDALIFFLGGGGKLTSIRVPLLVCFSLGFFTKKSNDYQISHGNKLSIPQNIVMPLLLSKNTG